jgi:DNA repair protein RecO (recombination protein O)
MKSAGHSSRAIVLSTEDFGEADRYVQFLTARWGVISALAKSARKSKRRYVGGLDLFCHDEIFLRGEPRERGAYLVELKVLNSFPQIREDLDRVVAAGKAVQWVKKLLPPSHPHPTIYSLLGQTLALIEKETVPARLELLVLLFKMKLLAELGLKPRVEACVKCGTQESSVYGFDLESGGVVCGDCLAKARVHEVIRVDPLTRSFMNQAEDLKLTLWQQIELEEDRTQFLSRLVTQFASFHTHVPLPV